MNHHVAPTPCPCTCGTCPPVRAARGLLPFCALPRAASALSAPETFGSFRAATPCPHPSHRAVPCDRCGGYGTIDAGTPGCRDCRALGTSCCARHENGVHSAPCVDCHGSGATKHICEDCWEEVEADDDLETFEAGAS